MPIPIIRISPFSRVIRDLWNAEVESEAWKVDNGWSWKDFWLNDAEKEQLGA